MGTLSEETGVWPPCPLPWKAETLGCSSHGPICSLAATISWRDRTAAKSRAPRGGSGLGAGVASPGPVSEPSSPRLTRLPLLPLLLVLAFWPRSVARWHELAGIQAALPRSCSPSTPASLWTSASHPQEPQCQAEGYLEAGTESLRPGLQGSLPTHRTWFHIKGGFILLASPLCHP